MQIVYVILGGSIGASLRYFAGQAAGHYYHGIWPVGTLSVNLIGSFVIGLLWGALEVAQLSPQWRNLIFVGILGSFTTYSTYSLDVMNLIRTGAVKECIAYLLISNILGLALVAGGFYLGLRIRS